MTFAHFHSAQTHDLKTSLAGQIARALAVFCVDELVIFNDMQASHQPHNPPIADENSYTGISDPDDFLMHLLCYLEAPPYLRKYLFPIHPNLRTAGTLPSLDMPHHMRADDWCQYRDGVAIEASPDVGALGPDNSPPSHKKAKGGKKNKNKLPNGSSASLQKITTLVEVGLDARVLVEEEIPPNTRVTLRFEDAHSALNNMTSDGQHYAAKTVAPDEPRREGGYYWGYEVRRAQCLSDVMTECPFDGGYDLTFGTSERGTSLESLYSPENDSKPIPKFRHMLLTFGGVSGLEAAVKADSQLSDLGIRDPEKLFDYWLNLCPGQGSRTIRTEEAVWIGLMGLRKVVLDNS
jgi:predicted SPOUT superfamily RNA methylase MTH1